MRTKKGAIRDTNAYTSRMAASPHAIHAIISDPENPKWVYLLVGV